ncbi:MAG: D-tyrosyl-tRNA(Tyr) deacylase [Clostridia bacterium]|nr:D-tyrosyl-tRNA(Tyr) deacylase [Clostridia bacterium]
MKVVIQRVKYASVTVDDEIVGSIDKGYLILLGIGHEDDENTVDKYVKKISNLRIFEDENNKMNKSIIDICGDILVVSQFTLYADCTRGNRPSFVNAGKPEMANELYEYFKKKCSEYVNKVESGVFGADMKVELLNDGPVTIILDEDSI